MKCSLLFAVIVWMLLSLSSSGLCDDVKIRVNKLDDLPKHTYPLNGTVSELIASEENVLALAELIKADLEADLAKYDIADTTTLQRMIGTLQNIAMVKKDYDRVLEYLEEVRRLEDKEAQKLTTGLETLARIAAIREVGEDAALADFKAAFRRFLEEQVAVLPFKEVQDVIQANKGRMEIMSENLLMGLVQAQMEPVVANTGELSNDLAAGVIGLYLVHRDRLPLKEEIIAVYKAAIDAHAVVKADIWKERSVTLTENQNLTPVLAGVWDSGTDPTVFSDRLFVNAGETINGLDDDDNGFIDDVNGIAYDIHANRCTGMLCPLGDAESRIGSVMDHMKGFMDIQADLDTVEAQALKKHLGSLKPEEVMGFMEGLGLAGNYSHGTHVAGIIAEGNPFVFLLIARLSYDHHSIPVPRTVDWGKRDGQKCRDTIAYFKRHGVRLVNMSWGEALADAESSLEQNGIGEDSEERRKIARKVFEYQKKGLYESIRGASDILFICAAGNSDNDVSFDEFIPSSFDLPNLLVVGAVDQAGDPTTFTSSGETVTVYANGFEVASYVPGGKKMKMSGTSMASPNVANLAAKLIALNPDLAPPEVIALIKEGADTRDVEGSSFLLINPMKSVALLKKRFNKD